MRAIPTKATRLAISVEEAAQQLSVCTKTIYRLMERGELTRVKVGRRTLVKTSELTRLVEAA